VSTQDDIYIVGLGASAGGFDALTKFLKHLPADTGAAYVIIQHLWPSYESQTHKLLASYTEMPLVKVSGKTNLKPDHIYVIPENKSLQLNQEGLYLEDRIASNMPNLVIDIFFESLANVKKEKAVGIILSGTGSDGAKGVQFIKAAGGMVMVQSPQSASFDSMPNVSISSDHPDYIAPPEDLAIELAQFLKTPDILEKEKLKSDTALFERDSLKEIINYISTFSGVNFKNYKPGTIIRRIEKRMKINRLNELHEYVTYMQSNPKEVRHVFDDLLIGVTRFFRDKEAFSCLKEKVIPKLFLERKSFEPLRIWVTGCSTGEEAYSLAILFDEHVAQNNLNVEFKIFATDINQRAIDIASMGRYSNAIEEDVDKALLYNYFNANGDYYEVKKEIRRRIIFSKHNLLNDPPFIRIDLISCRNLFIYLNDETQNKVLQNFNYSLIPEGYLFLGINESNNELDKLYSTVDIKHKIFQSKGNGNNKAFRPVNYFFQDTHHVQYAAPNIRHRHNLPITEEHYAELVADRFAPPSMIVNQSEDVVYTTGNLDRFLQFPNRRSDLNVYSALRGSLLLAFRNGLRQIREGKSRVIFTDVYIKIQDQNIVVDVAFSRIDKQQRDVQDYLILVEFHAKDTQMVEEQVEVVPRDKYSQAEIENLELELKLARKELRYTSDELETINEELQSSNEEMQSANEELQSTNEELQSANEELQTVNNELNNKIDTITILHDDMLNLFNSTQIATIFLDSSMNIRKFTPPAKEYFNIMDTDIGRPISHFSYNFNYHKLFDDVKIVRDTLQSVEHEIEHKERKYSIMRVIPYKTEAQQIKGVVITFTDITELKQKNIRLKQISEELRESEQHLKSLLDHTPDFIARFDENLKLTLVNKSLLDASGKELSNFIGKQNIRLGILNISNKVQDRMKHVFNTSNVVDYYFDCHIDGNYKYYYTKLVPEFSEDGKKVESILYISTDITELKQVEQKLIDKNVQLSEMYDRLDNFVHAVAHDLRSPIVNLQLLSDMFVKIDDPEKKNKFVSRINQSVRRLDHTLKGLIQIIEIENEDQLAAATIHFKDVTERVVSQLLDKINKEHVHIDYDFSACPAIQYIPPYVESIIKNLIGNAIKYRSPDRELMIQIKTEQKDGFVVLSVRDNGLGIDLEAHGHNLFKPFKRFHTHIEGVGVGLYTIKYMIAKKGGYIEVDSKAGEGSTFYIFLKPCDNE
jgi:two-component system, chemotaxis family, CheB/CheR fusion protein